jgi:hypothetical protein
MWWNDSLIDSDKVLGSLTSECFLISWITVSSSSKILQLDDDFFVSLYNQEQDIGITLYEGR